MKSSKVFKTYETSLRLYSGLFLFISGVSNPLQLEHFSSYESIQDDVYGVALLWTFFTYSNAVLISIGILKCVGATLLVFNKTKLIGAAILLPLMFNFVMFGVIYEAPVTPTLNVIAILGVLLLVFFLEKERVSTAVRLLGMKKEFKNHSANLWLFKLTILAGSLTIFWFTLGFLSRAVVFARMWL